MTPAMDPREAAHALVQSGIEALAHCTLSGKDEEGLRVLNMEQDAARWVCDNIFDVLRLARAGAEVVGQKEWHDAIAVVGGDYTVKLSCPNRVLILPPSEGSPE